MIKRPLTEEEKEMLWEIIYTHKSDDDRDPKEVIKDLYGGDEERYLKTMAKYLGIMLEE